MDTSTNDLIAPQPRYADLNATPICLFLARYESTTVESSETLLHGVIASTTHTTSPTCGHETAKPLP